MGDGSGGLTVNVTFATPPSNDMFAARTAVSGPSFTGTTVAATSEAGEALQTAGVTVWYSWTAPSTGVLVLTPFVTAGWVVLTVYADGNHTLAGLAPLNTTLAMCGDYCRTWAVTAGQRCVFQVEVHRVIRGCLVAPTQW